MNCLLQLDTTAYLAQQLVHTVLQNIARRTEQRGHLRSLDADVRYEMSKASGGLVALTTRPRIGTIS